MAIRNVPKSTEQFAPKTNHDYLDEYGHERPDDTVIAPPVGYIKQPTMAERIRDMVRSENLRKEAEAAGMETFEEADDFEVGDDYNPTSPYEEQFDPVPVAAEPQPAPTPTPPATPPTEAPAPDPTPPAAAPEPPPARSLNPFKR